MRTIIETDLISFNSILTENLSVVNLDCKLHSGGTGFLHLACREGNIVKTTLEMSEEIL